MILRRFWSKFINEFGFRALETPGTLILHKVLKIFNIIKDHLYDTAYAVEYKNTIQTDLQSVWMVFLFFYFSEIHEKQKYHSDWFLTKIPFRLIFWQKCHSDWVFAKNTFQTELDFNFWEKYHFDWIIQNHINGMMRNIIQTKQNIIYIFSA